MASGFLHYDRHLPDDAIVVRGGTMKLSDLRKTAEVCHAKQGIWGISVRSSPDAYAVDLAADIRHEVIRQSTAGQVREAGFEIYPSGSKPNHCTIVLDPPGGGKPSDEELQRLVRAFGGVQDRPGTTDYSGQEMG